MCPAGLCVYNMLVYARMFPAGLCVCNMLVYARMFPAGLCVCNMLVYARMFPAGLCVCNNNMLVYARIQCFPQVCVCVICWFMPGCFPQVCVCGRGVPAGGDAVQTYRAAR